MLLWPLATATGQSNGIWPWEDGQSWHDVVAWAADTVERPQVEDVLRAAAAELRIGRPEQALRLLEPVRPSDPALVAQLRALRGAASEATGNDSAAADLYSRAALGVTGTTAGVLAARAGRAFDRMGRTDRAFAAYTGAADLLPAAAGWLRLRAAGVAPTPATAESLLTSAPAAGNAIAQTIRAAAWLGVGDTAAAIAGYTVAGAYVRAAELALAAGDSADARTLAYRGLRERDGTARRAALDLVEAVLPPSDASEFMDAARAWAGVRETERAVRYGRRAVSAGDSSAETAVALGEWLEQSGARSAAVAVYARGGVDGIYLRARAQLRLGRRSEAARGFVAFASEHPTHKWAPLALYLAADVRGSDSLFRAVIANWPTHAYASRARFRVARRFLRRADTASAVALYASEVDAEGENARLARYLLARIRLRHGETSVARAAFEALARDDSVGYYGTIARAAVGLATPIFAPPPPRTPTPAVQHALRVLDLLLAAGFSDELALEIDALMQREWADANEMLDLAEGLIARGRGPLGVRLGWRATRELSLNDPRVIRVIFPWPNRTMIEREARKFDIDPYLLAALIRQESSFETTATSRAGARGFMQLMPATARDVARRLRVPWNETTFGVADANVHIGAAHFAGLLRQFDGNIVAALAAYNAGGSRARRWLRYPEASDPAFFVEGIPFVETRGYVRTVVRNHALYRALYGPPE